MVKGLRVTRTACEDIVGYQIQGRTAAETHALLGGPLRTMRNVPSMRSIRRVRRCWRLYGTVRAPKSRGISKGTPLRGLSASLARIIEAFCKCPDGQQRGTRLKRLRAHLCVNPRVNRMIPIPTLCKWLRRLGLTRKKGTRVALQQDPLKVSAFWARCQMLCVDPDDTVWFDESGMDDRDFRMFWGYALKGERFETVEKLGRGKRIDCLTSCDSSAGGLFCVDFVHRGTVQ